MMEVEVCIWRLFLLILSPYTKIIILSFLSCSTWCLSLVIFSEFLEPSSQDPPLWEGFIGKKLLTECCGHAVYSAMLCGLTVRGGARHRMTSAIYYVPFRFFSTLRPRLLFNVEEANGRLHIYVAAQLAAPIGSCVIRRTSLPRFTCSSGLLIADSKGEGGRVAPTNWYDKSHDKPCGSFLIPSVF